MKTSSPTAATKPLEILLVFLRLGCTCFGGPIAHLGYFRSEFVARRRWLDEAQYAELIALAQTLPGPSSSQVGFMVGLLRGGWLGGLAAWIGFTLPSALLMIAFAAAGSSFTGPLATTAVHTLQIIAVAVIAQAVIAMRKTLAPDLRRILIAVCALPIALFAPPSIATIACITLGALLGFLALRGLPPQRNSSALRSPISKKSSTIAISVMLLLLLLLPAAAKFTGSPSLQLASSFYRSGALVFGGGHVVLPLLQASTVTTGIVSESNFLSGYAAGQALPGPLFTFAAYLGYLSVHSPHHVAGAIIALIAIFLPGLLLAGGMLPFWSRLTQSPHVLASLAGINAAVIGLLAAALYRPGWVTAIHAPIDLALLLTALIALLRFRVPPWLLLLGALAMMLPFAHFGLIH